MNLNREITEIPREYFESPAQKGTVEKVSYTTVNYTNGESMEKYCYVYVPYGYDPTKKYNVWYYCHGGHELADKYLAQGGDENALKCFLDNLIEKGEIEPLIMVAPCFYLNNTISDDQDPVELARNYPNEFVTGIMPAVESRYSTYAETTDREGLRASRDHRYIAGWSMGSSCTWFSVMYALDCFRYINVNSGDCWDKGIFGGRHFPIETAEAVVKAVREQNLTVDDFAMYIETGTADIAYPNLDKFIPALAEYPDCFVFEGDKQNIAIHFWPDGEHHTQWRLQYIFNGILAFLKK